MSGIIAKSIIINSKDRTSGNTQNFVVDTFIANRENVSRVVLSHVIIPHTFKNININTNQIVLSDILNTDLTIDEISTSTERIRTTGVHSLSVNDSVVITGTSSTPSANGTFFVVEVNDTTHFQISATAGGIAIDFTDSGDNAGTVGQRIGDSRTFVMTPGNFNSAQLATQLGTELTADSLANGYSLTYTVVFSATADTFTFAAGLTEGFNLFWQFANTTMNRILGFTETSGAVLTDVNDESPLVSGIDEIRLHLGTYADGFSTDQNRQTDSVVPIPITSVFGERLVYIPRTTERYTWKMSNLHTSIRIRLSVDYNNGGTRVDLPSDSDWTIFLIDLEVDTNVPQSVIEPAKFIQGSTGFN